MKNLSYINFITTVVLDLKWSDQFSYQVSNSLVSIEICCRWSERWQRMREWTSRDWVGDRAFSVKSEAIPRLSYQNLIVI